MLLNWFCRLTQKSSFIPPQKRRRPHTHTNSRPFLEMLEDRAVPAVLGPDFNGDEFADLAVGVANENNGAGAVQVFYGSSTGMGIGPQQFLTQNSPGVLGVSTNANFGAALAWGDFNGDGFDDLAIGAPQEDDVDGDGTVTGNVDGGGVIQILYGSRSGLTTANQQYFSQNSAGVAGDSVIGGNFGAVLAAGDFNGDGRDDLAIGVPFADDVNGDGTATGDVDGGGTVLIAYGSQTGITFSGQTYLSQNTAGVAGDASVNGNFGAALAAGDFNGDGRDELVVGVPNEDDVNGDGTVTGNVANGGVVQVFFGAISGVSTNGQQFLSQNTSGIAGDAGAQDQFGAVLAIGDFNGDSVDDLAIGVPMEDDVTGMGANIVDGGAVQILLGSANGLSGNGQQYLSQNTTGVLGEAAAGDMFGASLGVGDFNGDGRDDLAIGVPFEDDVNNDNTVAGDANAGGAVQVLLGANGGLTTSGQLFISQDTAGVLGISAAGEFFGAALVGGDFNGDGLFDLAIGIPGESDVNGDDNAAGDVAAGGGILVLNGSATLGLTTSNQLFLSQDSIGSADDSEVSEFFGSVFATRWSNRFNIVA